MRALKKVILGILLLSGLATHVVAQQLRVATGQAIHAVPIRAAKIDASGRQVGPWIYLADSGNRHPNGDVLDVIFDTFENDRSQELWNSPPGADTYGPPTMAGSNRWFFGWYYAGNAIIGDQYRLNPTMRGRKAQFMQHMWAQGYTEQLYLVVQTAETFGYNTMPPMDGTLSGVVFDLGILQGDTQYLLSADLRGTGLEFQMGGRDDNNGSHQVSYYRAYDGTVGTYSLADQPMLWGTRGTNPSENHTYEWWDDYPGDGTFDPGECYEMWFGVEPDPLALMIAFYGYRPAATAVPAAYYTVGPPGKEMTDHDVTKLLEDDGREVHGRNTITGSNDSPSLLFRVGFDPQAPSKIYEVSTTVRTRCSIANVEQRLGYVRAEDGGSIMYLDTAEFKINQLELVRTIKVSDDASISEIIFPGSGHFRLAIACRKIGLVPSLRYDVFVDQAVSDVQL
ncbi:MAG: hypothetical protein HONBIEJF_00682 [Fimbriimonadaceae bacterium]|nr:hypothetical protein [Fimbriimonadaceae bacterium]